MRKLLIIGCGSALVSTLLACSARKSTIKTELKAVTVSESLTTSKFNLNAVTSFYGDTLAGTFTPDTNGVDSVNFESNGIKIMLKATKAKNGKTKVDFKAIAKPVARSALNISDSTKIEVKRHEIVTINQKNKIVQTRPYWLIGLYLILIIAVLLLLVWAYKKFRSWKKI